MIYLGLHVHKDSITIAVLPNGAKAPTRLDRLPNDLPQLTRFLDRCARDSALDSLMPNGKRQQIRTARSRVLS